MASLYLIALVGVSLLILGVLVEALAGVSRPALWEQPRSAMTLVETLERRHVNLPFVGQDRRRVAQAAAPAEAGHAGQADGRRRAAPF